MSFIVISLVFLRFATVSGFVFNGIDIARSMIPGKGTTELLYSQCLRERMVVNVQRSMLTTSQGLATIPKTACARQTFSNHTHHTYSFTYNNCSEVKVVNTRIGVLFYVELPLLSPSNMEMDKRLLAFCLKPYNGVVSKIKPATNIELFHSQLSENPIYDFPYRVQRDKELFLEIKDHTFSSLASPDPMIVPLQCWIGQEDDIGEMLPTDRSKIFLEDTCEHISGAMRWLPLDDEIPRARYLVQINLSQMLDQPDWPDRVLFVRCKFFRCSNNRESYGDLYPSCPDPMYCGTQGKLPQKEWWVNKLANEDWEIETATTDGLLVMDPEIVSTTHVIVPKLPDDDDDRNVMEECDQRLLLAYEDWSKTYKHYLPFPFVFILCGSSFIVGFVLCGAVWWITLTFSNQTHPVEHTRHDDSDSFVSKWRRRMSSTNSRNHRRTSAMTAESGFGDDLGENEPARV